MITLGDSVLEYDADSRVHDWVPMTRTLATLHWSNVDGSERT